MMYCYVRDSWHLPHWPTTLSRDWSWSFACTLVDSTLTPHLLSAGHHSTPFSEKQSRESCQTAPSSTENKLLITHPSLTSCWKDQTVCTDSPGSSNTKPGCLALVQSAALESENRSCLSKMAVSFLLKTRQLRYLDWQLGTECITFRDRWLLPTTLTN